MKIPLLARKNIQALTSKSQKRQSKYNFPH